MHIGFVTPESPVSGTGGIASYLGALVPALIDQGHRVTVVANSSGVGAAARTWRGAMVIPVRLPSVHWYADKLPVARHTITLPLRQLEWSLAFARAVARMESDSPDVLEATETGATFLSRVTSAPVVVRLHGSDYLFRTRSGQPLHVSARLNHALERYARRRARLLTAPSRFMAEEICAEEGWPRERVRVVPNPVDLSWPPSPSSARTRASSSESPFTVLYVGRLARVKGIDVLARAATLVRESIADARFVLAGPDQLSVQDREELRAPGLMVVGALDRPRLADLYRAADVFVMPSYIESFGISVIEAMSFGLPVVASSAGALTEIVDDGRTGLHVPPGDAAALAAALVGLHDSPAARSTLGSNARGKVMEQYSPAVIAKDMVAAYQEAIRRDVSYR